MTQGFMSGRIKEFIVSLERKPNPSCSTRHVAQARSWVISGAWMQKRLFDYDINIACVVMPKARKTRRSHHGNEWKEEANKMHDVVRSWERQNNIKTEVENAVAL